jgi:hypothetical protein
MNRWGLRLHHWQQFGTLVRRYKGRTGCKVRRRCFSARMQWPAMAFRSW